jgi:hypothetical protein
MVSGVLVMPVSQVLLALVGGWAWGRYQHGDPELEAAPSVRARATLCVLLVASVVVVGSSLQALSTIEERRSAYVEAVDQPKYWPRYWQQGYIGVEDASVRDRARPDR